MEEKVGQETGMDTQIPEEYEPSNSQRKRTGEKESGPMKNAKAHKKPLKTSPTIDDVELIATIVED